MYNRCGKVSSKVPGTTLPKFSSQTALGGVHDILYLLDEPYLRYMNPIQTEFILRLRIISVCLQLDQIGTRLDQRLDGYIDLHQHLVLFRHKHLDKYPHASISLSSTLLVQWYSGRLDLRNAYNGEIKILHFFEQLCLPSRRSCMLSHLLASAAHHYIPHHRLSACHHAGTVNRNTIVRIPGLILLERQT